jgi:hypothetical protein
MNECIAEIAGCIVMKVPLCSVTSYSFREEFFCFVLFLDYGSGGVGGSCQCAIGGLFLHR